MLELFWVCVDLLIGRFVELFMLLHLNVDTLTYSQSENDFPVPLFTHV